MEKLLNSTTTMANYGLETTLFNTSDGNITEDFTPEYEEYMYVYDYDKSVSELPPMYELIPVTIVYGVTLVLGVIGNCLVIFSIMHYRRMQNVTNIFLTSLASADLLLVLLCVPIKVGQLILVSIPYCL